MAVLRVGVVGASGQVGAALLRGLQADRLITAVGICRSRVSAARVASRGMQVRVVQTDDPARLAESTQDLDVLVNCALPQGQPSGTAVANQRLARSLAAACAGRHLVHLSSVAVYGEFISGRGVLFGKPKPDTGYGRQKLHMERLLQALARRQSLNCTILRVGHVYGAELRWSEAFFDLIGSDGFRLPFDGQLPSNAVGIWNLIRAIREVILNPPSQPVLNLMDDPQTTWRDVFDLHAQASGARPVEALSSLESARLLHERQHWAQTGTFARWAHETLRWAKQVPASYIAAVPTFKTMMQSAVARIPSERIDARLWAINCRRVAPIVEDVAPGILPIFLSEPVPGPSLAYAGRSSTSGLPGLQAWHDRISTPLDIGKLSNSFAATP